MKNLFVILILIVLLAGGGYWFYTTTPQYAVSQAADAMKKHDAGRFSNWVNVNNLSANMIEDLLAEPVKNSIGVGILERVVGLSIISIFKPTLADSMEKQIVTYVATVPKKSSAASQPDEDDDETAQEKGLVETLAAMIKPPPLKEVLKEYGFTKANYRGLGNSDQSGDTAHVGLKFFNPKLNQNIEVQLELNNQSGHWQIVRLSNLQFVLKTLAGIR
jgi:hypothetical protein